MSLKLHDEQAGKKMDKLITNAIIQVGASLTFGLIASLIVFKRKSWPIVLGAGFGVGAAVADISHEVKLDK